MDGALVGAKLLRPNLLLVSNFKDISPAPFPEKCSLWLSALSCGSYQVCAKYCKKKSKNAFHGILAEARQTFHHYQDCVISAHLSTQEVATLYPTFLLCIWAWWWSLELWLRTSKVVGSKVECLYKLDSGCLTFLKLCCIWFHKC